VEHLCRAAQRHRQVARHSRRAVWRVRSQRQRGSFARAGAADSAFAPPQSQALAQHLPGCSMEFWRTMTREHGLMVIVEPSAER